MEPEVRLAENTADPNRVRLELDRERLELERRRERREASFVNRHFGVIITAVISIAATMVSLAQIGVAWIQKEKENTSQTFEADRQWRMEAAKFIVENRSAIFSADDRERALVQRVISAAYPSEIAEAVLYRVQAVESGVYIKRFLSPDGTNIDSNNLHELKEWLKANGMEGVLLSDFLLKNEFEQARVRASEQLALPLRQTTITDVPEKNLEIIKTELTMDGATAVVASQQPDGRWTVSATFPAP